VDDVIKACYTCKFIKDCHDVTEQMLLEQKGCRMWQSATPEEVKARKDIADEFGHWVLKYTVPKLSKPHRKRRR